MAKEQTPSGDRSPQDDVPGVRGRAISQDMGTEPVDSGTLGDEGGAGAYPGGPTYSETSEPDSEEHTTKYPIPPTEQICGCPMEPPD